METRPDYPLARADGAVEGLSVKFADVNGIRTRYYEKGAGETVLLLHGQYFGAGSANTWAPVLDRLAQSFHVLAPDRLACGLTANPPTREGYSWGRKFEHINNFVTEMGVDRCHVIGQSRGLGPASYLVVKSDVEVETLVIANSSTLAPPFGDYGHRRTLMHQGSPALASSSAPLEEELRHFLKRYSYTHDHITDEFVQTAAYMQSQPKSIKALKIRIEEMEADVEEIDSNMVEIRDEIRNGALTCPVQICWGRNDPALSIHHAVSLFDMISQHNPNVRLNLFDRAGHHLYREYPEEFSRIVTTFIDHWKDNARTLDDLRPDEYAAYKNRLLASLVNTTHVPAIDVPIEELPDSVDLK